MRRDYEFSGSYTPEQAYAPPGAAQFTKRDWGDGQGGSLASSAPGPVQALPLATAGQSAASGPGRGMDSVRAAAESDPVRPNQEGFRASSDAGRAFASGSEALSQAQGSAAAMALDGTGQALMQRSQGLADARLWEEQQQQAMKDYSAQQKAAKRKSTGGGLLGAIGSVVGSVFGGPAGGAIGGAAGKALGGLFG
jgi:hypothetical protein